MMSIESKHFWRKTLTVHRLRISIALVSLFVFMIMSLI